jgi:hypothetical protein
VDDGPLPDRVHGLPPKPPRSWPASFDANVTVPKGVVWPLGLVAVTVAVHVVIWPTATLAGEQRTAVEVE